MLGRTDTVPRPPVRIDAFCPVLSCSVLVRRARRKKKNLTAENRVTQRKEWLPFQNRVVSEGGSYTYKRAVCGVKS